MNVAVSEAEAKNRFLEALDPDAEQARRMYLTLRAKLVFYFQQNGCADPQNLADEVFVRILRKFSEGAEAHAGIKAYCYGVAANVLREERRRPVPKELPDEVPLKDAHAPGALNRAEQAILVREFLSELPQEDRSLFVRYHSDDRLELSRELKTSQNGLRIRACRIRQRLKERIAAAGYPP
jgi:DNA-directed RNA polymerase specialized sigma24 family protein